MHAGASRPFTGKVLTPLSILIDLFRSKHFELHVRYVTVTSIHSAGWRCHATAVAGRSVAQSRWYVGTSVSVYVFVCCVYLCVVYVFVCCVYLCDCVLVCDVIPCWIWTFVWMCLCKKVCMCYYFQDAFWTNACICREYDIVGAAAALNYHQFVRNGQSRQHLLYLFLLSSAANVHSTLTHVALLTHNIPIFQVIACYYFLFDCALY